MSAAALSAMWVSLQLATLVMLIATPMAVALAWWMARESWPGKALLDAVILLPLGLPPAVIGFWLVAGLGEQGAWGHWLHHDQLERFLAEVKAFLPDPASLKA